MTTYESWLAVAVDAAGATCDYLRGVWRTSHAVQSRGTATSSRMLTCC